MALYDVAYYIRQKQKKVLKSEELVNYFGKIIKQLTQQNLQKN